MKMDDRKPSIRSSNFRRDARSGAPELFSAKLFPAVCGRGQFTNASECVNVARGCSTTHIKEKKSQIWNEIRSFCCSELVFILFVWSDFRIVCVSVIAFWCILTARYKFLLFLCEFTNKYLKLQVLYIL